MSPALRPLRLRRRSLVVIITLVGVVLSILGYWQSLESEQRRIAAEFQRRADMRSTLTREGIGNLANALFGLSNLFAGSDQVTRGEFAVAAREVQTRYPGISALEWVPVVPATRRTAMEAAVSRELGRPFQFTAFDSDGRMTRAPAASEHFPILYVEPLSGNERAFGYDLAFGPTTSDLTQARDSQQLTVSRRIRLIQETKSDRYSVIFIWPVLQPVGAQLHCLGFIQAAARVEDMLGHGVDEPEHEALDTAYFDPAGGLILYHAATAGDVAPADAAQIEAEFRRGLHEETKLQVGAKTWRALYRPSARWLKAQSTNHPAWRLLSGLIVTGLLASLMHVLGRRTETIEQEVEERTAELKESRRHLESIVQAVPGMVYRCSYDEQTKMLYVSDGATGLTGYAADEFMSDRVHIRDVIHPDDVAVVRQLTRKALQEQRPFEIEYRIRHRDGSVRWVLSRGRGIYAEAGTLRFLEGLVIDITERKQAAADKLAIERRLLEGQKLESLGLLAGSIAHDFSNLLTSVIGNAGLARMDVPAGSTAAGNLRQIELVSQHAAELCQQMLAYAGKGRLTVESIDLSVLLTAMKPLLQSSVSRTAKLELKLAPGLPRITADASQLRQIAINLVTNASDAIGEDEGVITITTAGQDIGQAELNRCATGRELTAGPYVIMEVRDTGCGMSAAMITRIFDPFFTTKFAGRGLGLAAVLGIVRGHNGALGVSSEPGGGSVFKLIMPPASTPEAIIDEPGPANARRRTVLVVDDDEPVCSVTAELLRSMDYEAETARSGAEALRLFEAGGERFAFVLLDIVMPGMNGFETVERLRAIQPNVRVLLMSGHDERDHAAKLALGGPLAYITKPFNRITLETILRELLNP